MRSSKTTYLVLHVNAGGSKWVVEVVLWWGRDSESSRINLLSRNADLQIYAPVQGPHVAPSSQGSMIARRISVRNSVRQRAWSSIPRYPDLGSTIHILEGARGANRPSEGATRPFRTRKRASTAGISRLHGDFARKRDRRRASSSGPEGRAYDRQAQGSLCGPVADAVSGLPTVC